MGRKKIKIAPITDDRNRSVTYLKRKAGLMKKAHELAILTNSEVAVIVFSQNNKLAEFSSSDIDHLLLRYTNHEGPRESKGPENFANDEGDSDEDNEEHDGANGGDAASGGGPGGASGMPWSGDASSAYPNGGSGGGAGAGSGGGGGGDNGSSSRLNPAGNNKKRKAMASGSGPSASSSSRRPSRPGSSAGQVKSEPGLDDTPERAALRVALTQRCMSKPGSSPTSTNEEIRRPQSAYMHHHHHSFSATSLPMASSQLSGPPQHQQRPYTAGAMISQQQQQMQQLQHQQQLQASVYGTHQRISPDRFAFTADGLNGTAQQPFTQPQYMVSPAAPPPQTYVELAGRSAPSSATSAARLSGPMQYPVQPQTGTKGTLLPLAHPALQQHPQYNQYAKQLGMQHQSHLYLSRGQSISHLPSHQQPQQQQQQQQAPQQVPRHGSSPHAMMAHNHTAPPSPAGGATSTGLTGRAASDLQSSAELRRVVSASMGQRSASTSPMTGAQGSAPTQFIDPFSSTTIPAPSQQQHDQQNQQQPQQQQQSPVKEEEAAKAAASDASLLSAYSALSSATSQSSFGEGASNDAKSPTNATSSSTPADGSNAGAYTKAQLDDIVCFLSDVTNEGAKQNPANQQKQQQQQQQQQQMQQQQHQQPDQPQHQHQSQQLSFSDPSLKNEHEQHHHHHHQSASDGAIDMSMSSSDSQSSLTTLVNSSFELMGSGHAGGDGNSASTGAMDGGIDGHHAQDVFKYASAFESQPPAVIVDSRDAN